jgi:hypothetical protein
MFINEDLKRTDQNLRAQKMLGLEPERQTSKNAAVSAPMKVVNISDTQSFQRRSPRESFLESIDLSSQLHGGTLGQEDTMP